MCWMIQGSNPIRDKRLFRLENIHASSEAHWSSCPVDTGDHFHGVRVVGSGRLITHCHQVRRLRMSGVNTSAAFVCLHGMHRDRVIFYLLYGSCSVGYSVCSSILNSPDFCHSCNKN
jgi:hypothetical protein